MRTIFLPEKLDMEAVPMWEAQMEEVLPLVLWIATHLSCAYSASCSGLTSWRLQGQNCLKRNSALQVGWVALGVGCCCLSNLDRLHWQRLLAGWRPWMGATS
jgi:hypothetical protein